MTNRKEDILFLKGFGQVTFDFVSVVFKSSWDQLKTNTNNKTFQELIKDKFTTKVPPPIKEKKTNFPSPAKLANFMKLPLPQLPFRLSKEVLTKSKFHRKNTPSKNNKAAEFGKSLYAQVSFKNIGNILKIKENFSKLSNKKIKKINKSIYGKMDKSKPRINITTRGLSYKYIIIPMSMDNANKFMSASSEHVFNFNWSLRNTKSDLSVDFIHIDHQGLVVTSNRVVSLLEISIVSNYVKYCNNINLNNIQDAHLPQSKSYLKILGILYILEGTNVLINSETIEVFIKTLHIFFDNVNIAFRPHIVKVFSKSDMAIIWINIWNSQNRSTAKKLINHCFNVSSFVATIRGVNMNPGISQCKNCWK